MKTNAIKQLITRAEQKIKTHEAYLAKWGIFCVSAKDHRDNEITKLALARLQNKLKSL